MLNVNAFARLCFIFLYPLLILLTSTDLMAKIRVSLPMAHQEITTQKRHQLINDIQLNKDNLGYLIKTSKEKTRLIKSLLDDKRINPFERQQVIHYLAQYQFLHAWLSLPFVKRVTTLSEEDKINIIKNTDNQSSGKIALTEIINSLSTDYTNKSNTKRPFLFSWNIVRFISLNMQEILRPEELENLKSLEISILFQLGLEKGWVTIDDLYKKIGLLGNNHSSEFLWFSRPIALGLIGHFNEIFFTKINDKIVLTIINGSEIKKIKLENSHDINQVLDFVIPLCKISNSKFTNSYSVGTPLENTSINNIVDSNMPGMSCWIRSKISYLNHLFSQFALIKESYLFQISKDLMSKNLIVYKNITDYVFKKDINEMEKNITHYPFFTDALGRPYLFLKLNFNHPRPLDNNEDISFLPTLTQNIIRNKTNIVEQELIRSPHAYKQKDIYGLYPLQWSIAQGNIKIFKLLMSKYRLTPEIIKEMHLLDLISYKNNPEYLSILQSQLTPFLLFSLYVSLHDFEKIEIFIKRNPDFDYNSVDEFETSLCQKILQSPFLAEATFELLKGNNLLSKCDFTHLNNEGKNGFHFIFSNPDIQSTKRVVDIILNDNPKLAYLVNQKDKMGLTTLYHTTNVHSALLNSEIQKTVNINGVNGVSQNTLLHRASQENDTIVVCLLLTYPDINVDAVNIYGVTPLHLASAKGNKKIVEALLNHGACLDHSSSVEGEELNAFRFALKYQQFQVASFIMNHQMIDPRYFNFIKDYEWAKQAYSSSLKWEAINDIFKKTSLKYLIKLKTLDNDPEFKNQILSFPKELLSAEDRVNILIGVKDAYDIDHFLMMFNSLKEEMTLAEISSVLHSCLLRYRSLRDIADYISGHIISRTKLVDIKFDLLKKMIDRRVGPIMNEIKNISSDFESQRRLIINTLLNDPDDHALLVVFDSEAFSLSPLQLALKYRLENSAVEEILKNMIKKDFGASFVKNYKWAKEQDHWKNLKSVFENVMPLYLQIIYQQNIHSFETLFLEMSHQKSHLEKFYKSFDEVSYNYNKLLIVFDQWKDKLSDEEKAHLMRTANVSIKDLSFIRVIPGSVGNVLKDGISHDGKYFLFDSGVDGSHSNLIIRRVLDGTDVVAFDDHLESLNTAIFSPDDRFILTTSNDFTAKVWDATNGNQLFTLINHTGHITVAVFSPNGQFIATTSTDGTLKIWDASTGAFIRSFEGYYASVSSVAFSPDSKSVVTGASDSDVVVWNVANGKKIISPNGLYGRICSVAFSFDGKYIAIGSNDNTTKVLSAISGNEISTLMGHTGSVTSIVFSPDNQFLMTSSLDGTAKIWNPQNGSHLMTLGDSEFKIQSAVFTPDGKFIMTTSPNKGAGLWEMIVMNPTPKGGGLI